MSKKIMQQALSALTESKPIDPQDNAAFVRSTKAIESLIKALAQSDNQEPVAWAVLRPDGRVKMLSHQQGVEVDLKWTPLYSFNEVTE